MTSPSKRRAAAVVLLLTLAACGGEAPAPAAPATPAAGTAAAPSAAAGTPAGPAVSPALRAIVDAPDRDPVDRSLDAGRKPAELLAFAGIQPGMKVAELAAGGGYTTELLARAVGPSGTVYGQNTTWLLEKFAAKPWAARLAKPVNKNVVSVTRDFDDPLPPEATNLDVVVMNLFYHDTVWMKTDRARMNKAVLKALKPGGIFVVIDHSAKAGAGVSEAQTTHRIEASVVESELVGAGFVRKAESDFLRNPADSRDWSTSPGAAGEKRGTSDRFALAFARP